MSTAGQPDGSPAPGAPSSGSPRSAGAGTPGSRANVWKWVALVLGLVAIGLLIWAINAQADLDDTQQQVSELQAQVDAGQQTGSATEEAVKAAYDELMDQLGLANKSLGEIQQQLEGAESKSAAVGECAKGYVSALRGLFEGGETTDEAAAAAKEDVESVTASCRSALGGP